MIEVAFKRSSQAGTYDKRISSFHVEGHALFAPKGEDIVCAAVSAVVIGTLNAIEALLDVELKVDMDEHAGMIRCDVSSCVTHEKDEQVQLLLEGMLVSLQSIELEYGDYLSLKEV